MTCLSLALGSQPDSCGGSFTARVGRAPAKGLPSELLVDFGSPGAVHSSLSHCGTLLMLLSE